MYQGSQLHSILNTSVDTGLDMCRACTEALRCALIAHKRYHELRHMHSMYQSSRLRSTLNTNGISPLNMSRIHVERYHTCGHAQGTYRSKPFHSSDSYEHYKVHPNTWIASTISYSSGNPFMPSESCGGLKSKNSRNTTTISIYTACSNYWSIILP